MVSQNRKTIIGRNEIKAMARVVAIAALFTVPFIVNHDAHANYGATAGSGAGFVLYMSLMHAR